jgi:hypothetical protein
MSIPIRIRMLESPVRAIQQALSRDISSRGVFFSSDVPLNVGARVEVSLEMPEQVVGNPVRQWRCNGRVVRTEEATAEGKIGVGVEFLYYEILKNRAPESIA